MYLPYGVNDKDIHCILIWASNELESSFYSRINYKDASCVIKWTERPAAAKVLNALFASLRSKEDIVWNTVL